MTNERKLQKDPTTLNILSAMLGVSNMGQSHIPMVEQLYRLRTVANAGPVTLESAVMSFAQQYMESDEHQRWFMDEAKSWKRNLSSLTWHEVRSKWPWVGDFWDMTNGDGPFNVKINYLGPYEEAVKAVEALVNKYGPGENYIVYQKSGYMRPAFYASVATAPWKLPKAHKPFGYEKPSWLFTYCDVTVEGGRVVISPAKNPPKQVDVR